MLYHLKALQYQCKCKTYFSIHSTTAVSVEASFVLLAPSSELQSLPCQDTTSLSVSVTTQNVTQFFQKRCDDSLEFGQDMLERTDNAILETGVQDTDRRRGLPRQRVIMSRPFLIQGPPIPPSLPSHRRSVPDTVYFPPVWKKINDSLLSPIDKSTSTQTINQEISRQQPFYMG